ncbi:MAG: class I SAM-dependent methyltransferase [Pseudomonadota bacterium]
MDLAVENYCNDIWPLVYEPYYAEDHAREFPFYSAVAAERPGPVLEVGSGTGVLFYKLLRGGVDVQGIDVSPTMLDALYRAARDDDERVQALQRVRMQDMTALDLETRFSQILVPARAFLHVAALEAQLATLRGFHAQLAEGGRLALNFFVPDLQQILDAHRSPQEEPFDAFVHPRSGAPIELTIRREVPDLSAQRFIVTWRFRWEDQERVTRMDLRWVHRDEFELMLRLAGFRCWKLFGENDRSGFGPHSNEMFWLVEK